MNLRAVPDPVWYGLLALVAVGGVYWLSKRAAGVVGDAARSAGTAAYNAGNAVQDALVPGDATLGTWAYDISHDDAGAFDFGKLARSLFAITPPGMILGAISDAAGDSKPASGAKPATYDYGTGSTQGIPYRPGVIAQPDPFNFSLDYLYQ